MPPSTFHVLDPAREAHDPASAWTASQVPVELRDHTAAAANYQASEGLIDALNTAIAVGAPLLLTGDPGTGKTQAAFFAAHQLGNAPVYPLHVTSETTSGDLLYAFDRIAYYHASRQAGKLTDKGAFVHPGPLWRAFEHDGPSVVLIDEVDKAPSDFPNSLLHVVDQHTFHVPEIPERVVRLREARRPPLVVITSNSERHLPRPFLRRCIFHHIAFDEELVRRVVEARAGGFPRLEPTVRDAAIDRFLELQDERLGLSKPPSIGELLVWLMVLSARGQTDAVTIERARFTELPGLACLVKDRDDLLALG